MRGQIQIETLVLVGFVLALAVPVIITLFGTGSSNTDDVMVQQGGAAVRLMVDSVNEVGLSGTSAVSTVDVFFPCGNSPAVISPTSKIRSITIGGASSREIVLSFDTANGPTDVVGLTNSDVTALDGIQNDTGCGVKRLRFEQTGSIPPTVAISRVLS